MNESSSHDHDSEVIIEEAQTVKVGTSRPGLSIPAAILFGNALIATAIFVSFSGASLPGIGNLAPSPGTTSPTAPTGDVGAPTAPGVPSGSIDVTAGDLPVLGSPNAPILVVEWSDFQCPFCARLFEQVEPQLKEQYIDTGKVRFAYRDFAFLGRESIDAAIAARCANEQGEFWAYHDKLFESQSGENRGGFSKEVLKGFARELGLDTATFNSCLDSDKYEDAVTADTNAGRDAGVSGTPTTFVNGRVVNGAQPFSAFQAIIDEELAK